MVSQLPDYSGSASTGTPTVGGAMAQPPPPTLPPTTMRSECTMVTMGSSKAAYYYCGETLPPAETIQNNCCPNTTTNNTQSTTTQQQQHSGKYSSHNKQTTSYNTRNINSSTLPPGFYDPYQLLHLRRDATAKEIAASYQRLALLRHPVRQSTSSSSGCWSGTTTTIPIPTMGSASSSSPPIAKTSNKRRGPLTDVAFSSLQTNNHCNSNTEMDTTTLINNNNNNNKINSQLFAAVAAAYETLSVPETRQRMDAILLLQHHHHHPSGPSPATATAVAAAAKQDKTANHGVGGIVASATMVGSGCRPWQEPSSTCAAADTATPTTLASKKNNNTKNRTLQELEFRKQLQSERRQASKQRKEERKLQRKKKKKKKGRLGAMVADARRPPVAAFPTTSVLYQHQKKPAHQHHHHPVIYVVAPAPRQPPEMPRLLEPDDDVMTSSVGVTGGAKENDDISAMEYSWDEPNSSDDDDDVNHDDDDVNSKCSSSTVSAITSAAADAVLRSKNDKDESKPATSGDLLSKQANNFSDCDNVRPKNEQQKDCSAHSNNTDAVPSNIRYDGPGMFTGKGPSKELFDRKRPLPSLPALVQSSSTTSTTPEDIQHYSTATTERLFGGPLQLMYRARRWEPFTDPLIVFQKVFGSSFISSSSTTQSTRNNEQNCNVDAIGEDAAALLSASPSAWAGTTETLNDGTVVSTKSRLIQNSPRQRRLMKRTVTRFPPDPTTGLSHTTIVVTSEECDTTATEPYDPTNRAVVKATAACLGDRGCGQDSCQQTVQKATTTKFKTGISGMFLRPAKKHSNSHDAETVATIETVNDEWSFATMCQGWLTPCCG